MSRLRLLLAYDLDSNFDGVVDAAGAATDGASVRAHALEFAADGRRVLLLKTRGRFARELIGARLGRGVSHAFAIQQAQDGDGSREGAAGLGHSAHACTERLEKSKRGVGIKTQCRGERARDGLGAVEALLMVGCSLSFAGFEVEFGHVGGVHGCPFRWRLRLLVIVLAFRMVGATPFLVA